MFKKLERREAFRLTHAFIMIGIDVYKALYEKRPASISRLVGAQHQMMHFVIHSDGHLKRNFGQWRMRRALAAAHACEVVLRRLRSEDDQRALLTASQEILERCICAYQEELPSAEPAKGEADMEPKHLDLTFIEHVQTANWLARLCYPIAVWMEVRQPASALKLMEASFDARRLLNELTGPMRPKKPERKIRRAVAAVKCVRSILARQSEENPKDPARVTAAVEIAERLLDMLQPSLPDAPSK